MGGVGEGGVGKERGSNKMRERVKDTLSCR